MTDYGSFAKTFSKSRDNLFWPEIFGFLEDLFEFKKQTPLNILDVGCGNARLLEHIEKLPDKPEILYTGVDSSQEMLDEAQKKAEKLDQICTFIRSDMQDIAAVLKEKKFDAIFAIASFHHLESVDERIQTLNSMKDLLEANGRIYMTNWHLLSEKNLQKYTTSIIKDLDNGSKDFSIKIGDFSRYYHGFTLDELEKLYELCSIRILKHETSENNILSILTY